MKTEAIMLLMRLDKAVKFLETGNIETNRVLPVDYNGWVYVYVAKTYEPNESPLAGKVVARFLYCGSILQDEINNGAGKTLYKWIIDKIEIFDVRRDIKEFDIARAPAHWTKFSFYDEPGVFTLNDLEQYFHNHIELKIENRVEYRRVKRFFNWMVERMELERDKKYKVEEVE